ncbi:MAG TPA: DUF4251 domain-containing protein [Gillisia sp.]|nr:DUF4251 domain-containing protein [Gillisia sp.]
MKRGLKMRSVFTALAVIMLYISCGSVDRKTLKDYDELQEAIASKTFEIEHQWALPLGGGMIDLIGNPNFIRIDKDSVDLYLPYFGVRHGGGGFNSHEGGLIYKGEAKNFSVTEESKRKRIIRFEGRQDQDQLRFSITVFPDGSANTTVMMAQRQTIAYRGTVRNLSSSE